MKHIIAVILLLAAITGIAKEGARQPEFSTAGFFALEGSPRKAESFNVAWRFHKGDIKGAEAREFKDDAWGVVNVPHGIEYVPLSASGCSNYQGVVWYRKHFTPSDTLKGKKTILHFEAVMGKSKIYVNGKLVRENFGGYLPFSVDLTELLEFGKDNVIAVRTDNSNDTDYPPGKTQFTLDYTYFGGIYRDVWLVSHNAIYITEATEANQIAGGGVFISTTDVSEKQATVKFKVNIKNETENPVTLSLDYSFVSPTGERIAFPDMMSPVAKLDKNGSGDLEIAVVLNNPLLWSPETPNLYYLIVSVLDDKGKVHDSMRKRFGIRSVEFKGKDGFWLNGKPIIGGNRHQDFAVIGNAVPNSLHWRDAKKMRDIGMKVVRNAHCPQDPAFMDACDELGLFVIVNNPGWQFWNNKPIFAARVKDDIRKMVRRDRNHPCVWFWEPVLNETHYPGNAAKEWHDITLAEDPTRISASDYHAGGAEHYPILYPHPKQKGRQVEHQLEQTKAGRTYFVREWGDCVDNWNSHNSPSRVNIAWGEAPQIVQAKHYAHPDYSVTCINFLHDQPPEYIGGTLWHTFDHQRGYHPDPFWGGVFDAFRQPKYSARMFQSQQDPKEVGGYIFIAHEMTPFSPEDVTIYSNCDTVKFTAHYGTDQSKVFFYERKVGPKGIRYPIITFKNAWHHMWDKFGKQGEARFFAEGYIDGKCVATHELRAARRPHKLMVWLDNENVPLTADGSDVVTVVAAISDGRSVKRLNNEYIEFSIEGEGKLLGGADVMANPRPVIWGTAPVLVQSTTKAGKIKVTAKLKYGGSQKAAPASLEFVSVPTKMPMIFDATEAKQSAEGKSVGGRSKELTDAERKKLYDALKEVEKQQDHFGEF